MIPGVKILIGFFLLGIGSSIQAQKTNPAGMMPIKGGSFVPLYGKDSIPVEVNSFLLDQYPVTNIDYKAFVEANPQWRKSMVKKIFADQGYLRHWTSDLNIGPEEEKIANSPVTNISWFAAKAYCECQGKRLPTVKEWEYAALASESKANASGDPAFYQRSLDWYSQPNPKHLPPVKSSFRNYYGVNGMIGLVWEWTLDFNSSLLVGESRANSSLDRQLFCGAGASGAKDVENYVAFMRYAFRSSLKASYTVANLGFRCAKDIKQEKPVGKESLNLRK